MTVDISRESTTTRGVLVAISIPIFTAQLEKAREATYAANLRAAYAEQSAALLTWDGSSDIKAIDVTAHQTQAGWQGVDYSVADSKDTIGGLHVDASTSGWTVKAVVDKTGKTDSKVEITVK